MNKNCKNHGQAYADDDEGNIVQEGVSQYVSQIRSTEEKLKVFQTHPLAADKQAVDKALAWSQTIVLEGKNNAKKRDIGKGQKPKYRWRRDYHQLQIIFSKPFSYGLQFSCNLFFHEKPSPESIPFA